MVAAAITEFSFGDYRVVRFVGAGRWRENCYIVSCRCHAEQFVIDPGYDSSALLWLLQRQPGSRVRILLTHSHHDHIGAAAELSSALGVPCELHAADLRLLKHASMYAQLFAGTTVTIPENLLLYDEASFHQDGELAIGILPTPGHTKGSVCYLFPGFVCTGDTLLHSYVGRTDLPGGDARMLAASVSNLLEQLPDDTVILPGHREPWDVAAARQWWERQSSAPPRYDFFEPVQITNDRVTRP